jgi:hypothetical protein
MTPQSYTSYTYKYTSYQARVGSVRQNPSREGLRPQTTVENAGAESNDSGRPHEVTPQPRPWRKHELCFASCSMFHVLGFLIIIPRLLLRLLGTRCTIANLAIILMNTCSWFMLAAAIAGERR